MLSKNNKNQNPFISIIVPSLNQGNYISRTIESVINQNYPYKELIVVDGGSTDNTIGILKQYKNNIIWISEPDRGYADAVNKGLNIARGNIIGIQSSDDYYQVNIFDTVAKLFKLNKNIRIISGRRYYINASGEIIRKDLIRNTEIFNFEDFITLNYIPPQDSTFVRREIVEKVGGLKIDVDYCADIDLWMRILGNGYCGLLIGNQFWSFRSIHDSQRGTIAVEKFAKAAKKSIDLWLNSPEFPKILNRETDCIEAIGYIRSAQYYENLNDFEAARDKVIKALEISPKISGIHKVSSLMDKLNIVNNYQEVFSFDYKSPCPNRIKLPKEILR